MCFLFSVYYKGIISTNLVFFLFEKRSDLFSGVYPLPKATAFGRAMLMLPGSSLWCFSN
jgi:hypothetical protein